MTTAAEDLRPLPRRIGRYRILCELGHGAMAVIYLGRAMGLKNFERLFAIKTIHEHLGREASFVDMFLEEARLAARIHHPNVIPVFDVDVDAGRYFIAMEYVSGESLASALKQTWSRGKPFPLEIAAHLIAEACEGLHSAHELKDSDGQPLLVVHRDVAPQNIMLGYDGAVRVMDFGIAKALDRMPSTRPGTLKGTVAYMAPEQIRCEHLDRRTDVFSLGVVLWETTVGKRLFKAENDINTAARVLRMTIPQPSSLRSDYPPDLDAVVMRALERDPSKRYPTARALSEELRDVLARQQKRVGPSGVESFVKDIFGAMYEERVEMEKKARAPEPPEHVSAPLRRGLSESSLEELDAAVGDVFETLGNAAEGAVPSDFEMSPTRDTQPTSRSLMFTARKGQTDVSALGAIVPSNAVGGFNDPQRNHETVVVRDRTTRPDLELNDTVTATRDKTQIKPRPRRPSSGLSPETLLDPRSLDPDTAEFLVSVRRATTARIALGIVGIVMVAAIILFTVGKGSDHETHEPQVTAAPEGTRAPSPAAPWPKPTEEQPELGGQPTRAAVATPHVEPPPVQAKAAPAYKAPLSPTQPQPRDEDGHANTAEAPAEPAPSAKTPAPADVTETRGGAHESAMPKVVETSRSEERAGPARRKDVSGEREEKVRISGDDLAPPAPSNRSSARPAGRGKSAPKNDDKVLVGGDDL